MLPFGQLVPTYFGDLVANLSAAANALLHFQCITPYHADMAWRNQGITGSNNIPLGNRRRFGDDSAPASEDGFRQPSDGSKRGRSPERGQ